MGIGPSTSACAFLSVEVSDGSEGGREVFTLSPSGGTATVVGEGFVGTEGNADDIQEEPPFFLQEQWLSNICGGPGRR